MPNHELSSDIQAMFSRIARRYDLMNRIMSGGRDKHWRRLILDHAALLDGERFLDVGTGTGDIALSALKRAPVGMCVGADFTVEMMKIGKCADRSQRIHWVESDALDLPFLDGSFDTVASGFLIRNLDDIPAALSEQYRVLRPGGRVVCLDTTRPPASWLRPLIDFHMHTVIPTLGSWIVGHRDAYAYLSSSTENFLSAEALAEKIRAAGFLEVGFQRIMFRTVALHWGVK